MQAHLSKESSVSFVMQNHLLNFSTFGSRCDAMLDLNAMFPWADSQVHCLKCLSAVLRIRMHERFVIIDGVLATTVLSCFALELARRPLAKLLLLVPL